MRVQLVMRVGCHLCADALAGLRQLGIEPELLDVDSDDRLFDLYDFRIPIILVDGEPALEGRITKPQLEALFKS